MTFDSQAAIIANDLDSLLHRIEALPAHKSYTAALEAVNRAKWEINTGRQALHLQGLRERHGDPAMNNPGRHGGPLANKPGSMD